jgi:gliding motility-associated-like protein
MNITVALPHKTTRCILLEKTLLLLTACFMLTALTATSQVSTQLKPYAQDSMDAMHRLPSSLMLQNQKQGAIRGTGHKASVLPAISSGTGVTAATSVCYDTSARFFLSNDSFYCYTNSPYVTQDGNLLHTGGIVRYGQYASSAAVLKTSFNGNLIWGKRYDSANNIIYNGSSYYRVIELLDGSLLLAGYTNNNVSGNDDLVFTKTDNNGNIIWSKTYKSRLWGTGHGSADYFYVQQMKQDPASGDVYFTGPFWADGKGLVRLNPANGNIVWSRAYNAGSAFDTPFGLDIRPQEIRLFSKALNSPQNRSDLNIYRINKATGDTISTRFYTSNDTTNIKTNFLSSEPLQVTSDGHYVLAGKCFGQYQYLWNGITPLYQAAVAEFDSNFNFIKAYCIKNAIESNSYSTRITSYPDKTGFFTMQRYISSYNSDVYTIHFNDGQIVKQRLRNYPAEGFSYMPLAARLPNGGSITIRLMWDSAVNLGNLEFIKMHPSDTASACIGLNGNYSYIYPFGYMPAPFNEAGYVQSNTLEESVNKTFTATPVTANLTPGCFQVSHCDTLKLLPSASVICVSQTLQITVRKNAGCGSNVTWQYPATVVSAAQQVNDSVFAFTFAGPWAGYMYGSIQGCGPVKDSVFISVLQAPAFLNLGPDTSLCPGNTIVLNAHTGYATYLWQNGSTDSTFTVTTPGMYSVQTTDACGGIFRDTVIVNPRPPVPVYIGPDRTKCNNDTLQLQAPAGFISYQWLPNYNISSTTAQLVTVNPQIDTTYYVKAEKTPGCFGFDTVHIIVYRSPAINLGNDTNICAGQVLTLNAGTGFASYVWSNNAASQQITVNTAGTYSVKATTTQGCTSKDTLTLTAVNALPVITLNKNPELCIGSSRVLDPGAFATYLWQNGSTGRTYTTSNIGRYYVRVTNTNGCSASDTMYINTLLPLPANFLPADTAICNYGTITLQAVLPFAAYLWSTGNSTAVTVIDKPGIYWLEVKDAKDCTGRDTIQVLPKQCLKGLFVPNAFTPDGDGKNDKLKALLFGDTRFFEFSIYNRYGELIFKTTDTNQRWDGTFKGKSQEAGTYVWTCKYILADEPLAQQQGTVLLIR